MVDDKNHNDRAHAKYGPSSMKRLVECPVSAFIGIDIDEPPQSSHAAAGTLAHECSEIMLEAKLEGKPYPKLDKKQYDPDMQKYGIAYADYVYGVVEEWLFEDHAYFIERRVTLDKDRDIWGTADFVIVYELSGELHVIIIDYKYGMGVPVKPEGNWQLITYGLAAAREFSKEKPVATVECHIFQPRTDHETPPVKYDMADLEANYLPKIVKTIDLIESWIDDKTITTEQLKEHHKAGDWCQFCKAKGICKPYKEMKVGKSLVTFKRAKEKLPKKQIKEPDSVYGVLSEEEIAFICLNSSTIKNFVDATVKAASSILKKGETLDGLKMVEASSKRQWIKNEKKLIAGLKELGIKEPKVTTEKIVSITEVEKEIGKDKLGALTNSPGKNYKIVSADDPTPATKFGLDRATMFKEVSKKSK